MYHIGKVLKVLRKGKEVVSSDESIQAACEMWDENQLTLLVDGAIADDLKENDIVLVDYRPMEQHHPPTPSQTITKILKGKAGEEVWQSYKKYFEKKKKEQQEPEFMKQKYVH